jgi:hypothetical protein
MSDINPVQIEQSIRECAQRIAKGVTVCANAYSAWLAADHEHDIAEARAYMSHDGPAHEKKHAATLATIQERQERDAADAAYRYADRQSRALTEELRAWQSVGASVRQMYGVAGRGDS